MGESTLTKISNVIVAVCAIVLTWYLIRGGSRPSASDNTTTVPEWDDVVASGHLSGTHDAPVQFVIFEDFDCPICGEFARKTIPGIQARYPGQVAFTFRHYPLDYHRAAYKAAVGAECAAEQGWFEPYRTHLFSNQSRLDPSTIQQLGVESGIPDSTSFIACSTREGTNDVVERDRSLAQRLSVPGTPGILVNGHMLRVSPDSLSFALLVDSLVEAGN